MKITNAEVIRSGEQDLIDAITADLDWGAIEEIFLKEHNLGIEEDIEYKKGDIVAFEDQIAYKLEFEVKVNLSVLLDRNGDYISVTISGKQDNGESPADEKLHEDMDSSGDDAEELLNEIEEQAEAEEESQIENESTEDPVDEGPDTDNGYREALAELDSDEISGDTQTADTDLSDKNPEQDIEKMESQVGEIMENISKESKISADNK
jgi:hypothetical protein